MRRFAVVFACAAVIISGAQMLRGRPVDYAVLQGLIWGAVAATIFTVARIYQSRRGQHCAICRDTPELATPPRE
jgi:type IV secretory pathway VirB2 component (pilin)